MIFLQTTCKTFHHHHTIQDQIKYKNRAHMRYKICTLIQHLASNICISLEDGMSCLELGKPLYYWDYWVCAWTTLEGEHKDTCKWLASMVKGIVRTCFVCRYHSHTPLWEKSKNAGTETPSTLSLNQLCSQQDLWQLWLSTDQYTKSSRARWVLNYAAGTSLVEDYQRACSHFHRLGQQR